MGDTHSMAMFSTSLGSVAALGTALGSAQQASAARDIAGVNAGLADRQATDALLRGSEAEQAVRRRGAKILGSQRAALAAGNVVSTSGTSLAVLEETQRGVDADAAAIRAGAGREAYGRKVGAAGYRAQAAGYNPSMALTGSLLTGASQVADRWLRYKDAGY